MTLLQIFETEAGRVPTNEERILLLMGMRSFIRKRGVYMNDYYYDHIGELIEMVKTVKECAHSVAGCNIVVVDDCSYDSFNFVINNVITVLKKSEVLNLDMSIFEKNNSCTCIGNK